MEFLSGIAQIFASHLLGKTPMTQDCETGPGGHDVTVEDLVDYSIQLSHVDKADHIMIVGRKSLGLLFGVCRRGFAHADCRMARGPHTGEPPADSLWILNTHDAAELRTLIADCGRDLRADGTLIVGPSQDMSDEGAVRLKDVLARCGYVRVNELHPRNDVHLLAFRKLCVPKAMAA